MATVYNCLDALVECGLARQVTLERGATRFCPNMREHCHFYCDQCQSVFDIELPAEPGIALPKGYRAERYDIAIHGRCPACDRRTAREGFNELHESDDGYIGVEFEMSTATETIEESGQDGIQVRLRHRRGSRCGAAGLE